MGLYTFTYIPDTKEQPTISVQFDDHNGEFPFIEHVISAFEQFLLGVTFQPGTIRKYIDIEAVQKALMERAKLVRELR